MIAEEYYIYVINYIISRGSAPNDIIYGVSADICLIYAEYVDIASHVILYNPRSGHV